MTPFEKIERELRLKSVIIRMLPGEHRIEHGKEQVVFESLDAHESSPTGVSHRFRLPDKALLERPVF